MPVFIFSVNPVLSCSWQRVQLHLRHIKQNRKLLYTNLLISGKLNGYRADIDKQADDMFFRFVKQMTDREGVTEQLKAESAMLWVQKMNSICSRVRETVDAEIIYT